MSESILSISLSHSVSNLAELEVKDLFDNSWALFPNVLSVFVYRIELSNIGTIFD